MRVASSRLDIVNEADSLVQKTQQQADHFRKLKKKAMSLPVIGSIVGTVGGVLLIRMFAGKKSNPAPPRSRALPEAGLIPPSSVSSLKF